MNITDTAREFILQVLSEQSAKGIRILWAGYGWGGPKVDVSLDEPQENDIVEEVNGVRVAFENRIYTHMTTKALDLQKTQHGEGIVIVGGENC